MKKVTIIMSFAIVLLLSSCLGKGITGIDLENGAIIYNNVFEVNWNDIKNADEYKVQVSQTEDFSTIYREETVSYSEIKMGNAYRPDLELEPGDYYFRVKGIIKGTEIASWSDPIVFRFYPTLVSIDTPLSGEVIGYGSPLTVSYNCETLADGTVSITIADNNDFNNPVYEQTGEKGIGIELEIPELEQGEYYVKAVFSSALSENVVSSDNKNFRIESPFLTVREPENSQYASNIYGTTSNGQTRHFKSIPMFIEAQQVQSGANSFVFGYSEIGPMLYVISPTGDSLKDIILDQIPGSSWSGISAGDNSIYITGCLLTGGEGTKAAALQFNAAGTFLRKIETGTINGQEIEGFYEEKIQSITPIGQNLLMAGDSLFRANFDSSVWVAVTDTTGSVIKKVLYTSPANPVSMVEYLGETEKGYLFLGKKIVNEDNAAKPVVFYYNTEKATLTMMDLLAEPSTEDGDALILESRGDLIVGWGNYLLRYSINTDDNKWIPGSAKELHTLAEMNGTPFIVRQLARIDDDNFYLRGEFPREDQTRQTGLASISIRGNADWEQFPGSEQAELRIRDYPIDFLVNGRGWAPWRSNKLITDSESDIENNLGLIYFEDGVQAGAVNIWDSTDEIFGPTLEQAKTGFLQDSNYYAYETEGLYIICWETYREMTLVTSPDWVFANGLQVGMPSWEVEEMFWDTPPINDDYGMSDYFTRIVRSYDYVVSYYYNDWTGLVFFMNDGQVAAIGVLFFGR